MSSNPDRRCEGQVNETCTRSRGRGQGQGPVKINELGVAASHTAAAAESNPGEPWTPPTLQNRIDGIKNLPGDGYQAEARNKLDRLLWWGES